MSSAANIPVLATDAVHKRHYALWARDYDDSPNPLLSLEERYLTPLLPEVSDKDVLDVGCGTGRWLNRFVNSGARSLVGIDLSPEMLARARQKLGRRAQLAQGYATELPIAGSSADIVISSFVASYVSRFDAYVSELRRVVRDNGRIYIADIHPQTELSCHWKRGFRTGREQVRLATCSRSLSEVVSRCGDAGLSIASLLEPVFGPPEREIFGEAGKLDSFYAAAELPAIYILGLRLSNRCSVVVPGEVSPRATLQRARISLNADTAVSNDLEISDGRIEAIRPTSGTETKTDNLLDLRGYLLLPGLINAHDHLEFGLYPNLGYPPYRNFMEWATDIHQRDRALIAANKAVPRDVQLWWGAIRNVLCGVTTVCHHNPIYPELVAHDFPVKVVKHCEWAHSLSIDSKVGEKIRGSSSPFVLHAGEGVDEQAQREIHALDDAGALIERTVLVHGLAVDRPGIDLLNKRSAALIWCPSSNQFLFGRTHRAEAIASIHRVVLGSDSPLTAAGDLLDEVRFAKQGVGVSANELYRMVFESPVDVLRLTDGEGRIRVGGPADFIAVRDHGVTPAESLARLTFVDVELVVLRGRVQAASDRLFRRLPSALAEGLKPLQVESELRWVRAPLGRLFREAERRLGCHLTVGGKRVRHVCSAWL